MAWERSQLVQPLRTERPLVGTLLLALAVEAGLSVLEPWPIQIIFDNVILERPPAALLVSVGGSLWQKVAPHLLGVMIALLIGLALMHGAASYVQNVTLSRLTQRVVNRLRVRLFSHVLDLPGGRAFSGWAPVRSFPGSLRIPPTSRRWWREASSS